MATATAEVTEPSQSNAVGLLSFEVGIVHDSTATSVADTAKVMKIECQLKDSNSRPVTKNPPNAPIPAPPAHPPTARGRLSSGTPDEIRGSVEGMTIAAPTPARQR